jgi:hypothetical protein
MTSSRAFVIALAFLAATNAFAAYEDDEVAPCNAAPDPARIQYVIAYAAVRAGVATPVTVSGYQRGWYIRSRGTKRGTTYLGVIPDAASSFNAVMYQLDAGDLAATDQRERLYCRVEVVAAAIKPLAPGASAITNAQIWVYEIPPGEAAAVDEDHPIAQTSVDAFLAGCLEQEGRYKVRDFAAQCVRTTTGWSAHWVDDRLYSGRSSSFRSRVLQIDKLLAAELPSYRAR